MVVQGRLSWVGESRDRRRGAVPYSDKQKEGPILADKATVSTRRHEQSTGATNGQGGKKQQRNSSSTGGEEKGDRSGELTPERVGWTARIGRWIQANGAGGWLVAGSGLVENEGRTTGVLGKQWT